MIIGGLTFRIYPLSKNLPLVEGFQILLSDRDSENIFHKDRFNLDGVELKTSIKEPGYKLYDLKIYKEIYLEDHDNFRCKNYANFGDYNSVRKTAREHFWLRQGAQGVTLSVCLSVRPSVWIKVVQRS